MQTDFNVYYTTAKGKSKRLHHIHVADVADYEEALKEVKEMLHKNMEAYYNPLMVVINGDKP